jgi:signal peptide peptidase SppA
MTAPWAIQPDKLKEIQAIYEARIRGEKIDLRGLEARIGEPLNNEQSRMEVVNGVAVIPVEGVIAKRMNMLTKISGGSSTELIEADVKAALADFSVKAIVLAIDSPGGTIDGTQGLARTIFNGRGTKPIIAYADGMMASAAYWIGAAADKVVMSGETAMVGSIGVVATHVDMSGAEKQRGTKTTEIYAGKYKRIASQYAPLTEEGRQTIQDMVDYQYSVFVNDVAAFRGVTADRVIKDMADGRVFIGTQAHEAGLVDGFATLEGLISGLASDGQGWSTSVAVGSVPGLDDARVVEAEKEKAIRQHMAESKVNYKAAAIAVAKERPELFQYR